MPELSGPEPHCRGLWSSVVLPAIEDIENQPLQSLDYADAVAFFTRSGSWAEWRATVADFLDMHRDELEALADAALTRGAPGRSYQPRHDGDRPYAMDDAAEVRSVGRPAGSPKNRALKRAEPRTSWPTPVSGRIAGKVTHKIAWSGWSRVIAGVSGSADVDGVGGSIGPPDWD